MGSHEILHHYRKHSLGLCEEALLLPASFGREYAPPPPPPTLIVHELCESRGGRPGLSVLTSLLVSVDVKQY